jgi:hypothetical protein
MSFIDTYQLATGGQNFVDTFTLASNGILIDIQVTPIPPIPPRPGGGSSTYGLPSDKKKEKDKKKITVTVTMPDGIKYTESVVVEDKPNLTAKDVQVEVLPTNDRPKIKISF